MKCPFCGEEMKDGFVRSGAARVGIASRGAYLYWNDEENKCTLFSNGLRLHTDQFDKLGFALTQAYKCDACRKVILDTYVTDGRFRKE